MKPLFLELTGLQSYIDTVQIDFERLGRFGLFGIFGPIGSGKSTLLDALTLALYGLIDRVSGRSKKGIMNADADRLEVRLRFSIRPPDGGDPSIFEVHRAYREVDGVAQRVSSRLVQQTTGTVVHEPALVLADKEREVNDAIADIVGLCAEDFMRAVVLPQGRFLDVLHLKGSERRGMLQRVFHLSAYGAKLRHKLRRRQEEARERVAALQGELVGLGPASASLLKEARAQSERAESEKRLANSSYAECAILHQAAERSRAAHAAVLEARALRQQLSLQQPDMDALHLRWAAAERLRPQASAAGHWAQTRIRAQQSETNLQLADDAAQAAVATMQRASVSLQEARSAHGEQAEPLRARISGLEEAEVWARDVQDQALRISSLVADADSIQALAETNTIALETVRNVLTAVDAQRRSHRRKIERQRVTPEERVRMAAIVEAHRALTGHQSRRDEAQARLTQAEQAHQIACDHHGQVHAAAVLLREAHDVTSRERAAASADPRLLGAQDLRAKQTNIDAWERALDRLAQATAERDSAATAYTSAQQHDDQREDGAAVAKRNEAACKAATDEAVAELRLATTTADQKRYERFAGALAARLEPGVPCEVCGSPDHPVPVEATPLPALAAGATPHSSPLQVATDTQQAMHASWLDALRDLASANAARQASAEDVARKAQALVDRQASVHELIAALPTDDPAQAIRQAREALEDSTAASNALALAIAAEQQSALNAERAESPVADGAARIDTSKHALDAADRAFQLAEGAHGAAWTAWSAAAGDTVTVFEVSHAQARLLQRDKDVRDLEQALSRADIERDTLHQKRSEAQSTSQTLAEQHRSAIERCSQAQSAMEALTARLQERAGSRAIEPQLAEANGRLTTLQSALRTAESTHEVARSAHTDAAAAQATRRGVHEGGLDALTDAWAAWSSIAPELADHAPSSGPLDLSDAAQAGLDEQLQRITALPDPTVVSEWRQRFDRHRGEVEQVDGRIAALDAGPTAEVTDEAFAASAGRLDDAVHALDTARGAVVRAHAAVEQLQATLVRVKALTATLHAEQDALQRMSHLANVLRGDRFVEFVANDLLAELASTASLHLADLTEGRYALTLDAQGGFIVRDDDAGGATRPVHSLSGGEAFLSSLALALALSTQIQARGARPLEFFFLDEGFGSLDPEALDRVMTAIERLRDGHRIIGLISHVPGVQERVPVHLVVHAAGSKGRGSTVELHLR